MFKKFLSLFLVFAMLVGQAPAVLAVDNVDAEEPPVIVQEVNEDASVNEQEESEDISALEQAEPEDASEPEQDVSDDASVIDQEEFDDSSDALPEDGDASENDEEIFDEVEDEAAIVMESFTVVPDCDLPNDDELFAGYAEKVLYGDRASTFGIAAGARLSGDEKVLYDAMVPIIKEIAAGERDSAEIAIGQEVTYEGTLYPVDAEATFESNEFTQENISSVVNALLADYPYEMYWYNKTFESEFYTFTSGDTVLQFIACFIVLPKYAGDTMNSVNTEKTGAASAVTEVCHRIVSEYADASDYEKLVGYKNEICALVEYDFVAAEGNIFSDQSDSWQLINVFDEDESTNVVCEGYSKAFMYLCDLTDFDGDVACYTVSGEMDGGGHMWNIVTINGKNYFADITDCDSGMVGQDGGMFLVGGSGSASEGYVFLDTVYEYDEETLSMWGDDADSILTLASEDYDPDAEEVKPTLFATWRDGQDRYTELRIGRTGNYFYTFWFGSGDDVEQVAFEDLTAEGCISISDDAYFDNNGQELHCVWMKSTGYGEGKISYTHEGETYEFLVTCPLPAYWLFSSEERSLDTYLDVLRGKTGETLKFYLLPEEGFPAPVADTLRVTDIDGNELTVESYDSDTGLVELKLPERGGLLHFTFNNGNWSESFSINFVNTAPHLLAVWPEDDPYTEAMDSITIEGSGEYNLRFYFWTGEDMIEVGFNDLTAEDGVSLSEGHSFVDGEQVDCVWVTATEFVEGAKIRYTYEGETYEFPVTRVLPRYGLYSENTRSELTYLDRLVSEEADATLEFYLLRKDGYAAPVTLRVTAYTGNETAELPVESFDPETGLVKMKAPKLGCQLEFFFEFEENRGSNNIWIEYVSNIPRLFAVWPGDGLSNPLDQVTTSKHTAQMLLFYFGTPENPQIVPVKDLKAEGGVDISETEAFMNGERVTYLNVSVPAFGEGDRVDGKIVYDRDGVRYEFPVTRVLPEYGFYSENTRSSKYLLDDLRGDAGSTLTFYVLGGPGTHEATGLKMWDNYGNELDVDYDTDTNMASMVAPEFGGSVNFEVQTEYWPWSDWISYVDTAPHLFAKWPDGDDYAMTSTSMTPSEHTFRAFEFYFGNEEEAVRLYAEDLEAGENLEVFDTIVPDKDGNEKTATAVMASAFCESAVLYKADGKTYTFPITVMLPTIGLYSSDTPDQDHYIESYDAASGEPVTVYLMAQEHFFQHQSFKGVSGTYYSDIEDNWVEFDLTTEALDNGFKITFDSPGADVDFFVEMENDFIFVSLFYVGEPEEPANACGEDLIWEISDGTLYFLSNGIGGHMYEYEPGTAPWYEYADEITKIDMQGGITISDGAFYGLTNVTEVSLPESLLYFQDAFGDCTALERFEIPAENGGGYIVTEDGLALLRSNIETEGTYTLYAVAPTAGEEFTIPNGTTCVHFNAFKNCADITTLKVPVSTTLILENAFSGCEGLTTVNYVGTEANWEDVEIQDGNEALLNAEILCDNTDSVTKDSMDEAIESAENDVVEVPVSEHADAANIPAASVGTVAEQEAALKIALKDITVDLNKDAVAAIAEQAKGSEITVRVETIEEGKLNDTQQDALKDHNVVVTIQASVLSDGEYISDFKGGKVTLSIPYALEEGKDAEDFSILYVADNGEIEVVDADYKNGAFVFTVEHFSEYVITEESDETEVLLGDVYVDGVVDIFDLITLKRYVASVEGTVIHELNADVNCSGSVDIFDLILLQRFIAKIPGVELG